MSTSFTTVDASGCIVYTLVDPTTLAPVTPPSYMTFSFPALTLYCTTPNTISTDSTVLSYRIKAYDTFTSAATYQTLTISIYHECHPVTIASKAAITLSYTVLSGTIPSTLDPFTITGQPSGEACYTYALFSSGS